MHGLPGMLPHLGQIVYLGMAVVAGRDAVISAGSQNLIGLYPTVLPPRIGIPGLQETTTSSTTIVVGAVGVHIHKILLADYASDNKPQILGHGVPKGFAHQLAGVLDREFDFKVPVPVGIDLQFTFPDPLGVVLNNTLDLKIVRNVVFCQPGPDGEKFVPSFRIEPNLAAQIFHSSGLCLDDVFPAFIVG